MRPQRMALVLAVLLLAALAALLGAPQRPAHADGVLVTQVSAGGYRACALTEAGGVKCWGSNLAGALGDGTEEHRTTLVDVCQEYDEAAQRCAEPFSGVAAISAGRFAHTCALTTAGGLKCWGWNRFGQLGTKTSDTCGEGVPDPEPAVHGTPCHTTPADVVGLGSGVAAVSAGRGHTCALMQTGRVKCWGLNSEGQVGDGTSGNVRETPVDVCQEYDRASGQCLELLAGVVAIAAGSSHTCAVTAADGAKCWGSNGSGELGTRKDELCRDEFGVLVSCTLTPVDVCQVYDDAAQECLEALSGVVAVTLGGAHTCALIASDGVKCWGDNLIWQLGTKPDELCPSLGGPDIIPCSHAPLDVDGLTSGAAQIDAGSSHTCIATTSGGAKCWGDNAAFALGTPAEECAVVLLPHRTYPCSRVPIDVCQEYDLVAGHCSETLPGVAAVSAGVWYACALMTNGGVKCWGSNLFGALGTATEELCEGVIPCSSRPIDVDGLGPKPAPTPTPSITSPAATPTPVAPTATETLPPVIPAPTQTAPPTDGAVALPSTGAGANAESRPLWPLGLLAASGLVAAAGGLLLRARACPERSRREGAP